ncbi:MAG TPA: hypothetical protein VN750_25345, partial [Steroidobacteraceae bacterium]|nr:hypothetical protein [Steroidobacteraceae bacterium]
VRRYRAPRTPTGAPLSSGVGDFQVARAGGFWVAAREPDSAVSQDGRGGLQGLRILLVEDEPGSREGTARLLQAHRSRLVKEYLESLGAQIALEYLPAYALAATQNPPALAT